jgi:cytochrome c biogenesis protein ResB
MTKRDRVGIETEQEPKGGFFYFLINILMMGMWQSVPGFT